MAGRLSISIIGTTGPDPRYWPGTVFTSDLAEAVVVALAAGPGSVRELVRTLQRPDCELGAIVEQLLSLRAIREEGSRLWLNFSLLTREDLAILDEAVPALAHELARFVLKRGSVIEAALRALPGGSSAERRAEYAFAVVGCLGLDWEGISTLKRCGYVSLGPEYPDGGRYVLIGEERRDVRRTKDYCGSHTGGGVRYFFTSFGDHSGPRHCLPDLLFQAEAAVGDANWPNEVGSAVVGVVREKLNVLYDELGAMVAGEAAPEGPHAQFLARIGYVTDGRAAVPVLRDEALGQTRQAVAAVAEAVEEWAERTVPELGQALSLLTPIRQGVDRGHFLNHIWHFIFAEANRILAERGFILDPEPGHGGQGRYLAWVAEAGLYRALWPFALPPAPSDPPDGK
ncbi:TPA: hypothetical protein DCY67_01350 [Candidatus Acetothermia bacterium]|nr:hypothetical protein [Candidatus Acetothermia bacterium]